MSNLWSNKHATNTKTEREERRKVLRCPGQAEQASKDQGLIFAVLIHLAGFYLLSGVMAGKSADNDLLSVWYASFLAVDVIALCLLKDTAIAGYAVRVALTFSAAWSAGLAIDMMLPVSLLQAADQSIQPFVDVTLFVAVLWQTINPLKRR